ncbi:MAG: hypothetical protein QXG98_04670 [Candidatus Micrarchaeia archaeon]
MHGEKNARAQREQHGTRIRGKQPMAESIQEKPFGHARVLVVFRNKEVLKKNHKEYKRLKEKVGSLQFATLEEARLGSANVIVYDGVMASSAMPAVLEQIARLRAEAPETKIIVIGSGLSEAVGNGGAIVKNRKDIEHALAELC